VCRSSVASERVNRIRHTTDSLRTNRSARRRGGRAQPRVVPGSGEVIVYEAAGRGRFPVA